MINSIQHFEEVGIKNLEDIQNKFLADPTAIAEFVLSIQGEVLNLGQNIFKETLEAMDDLIRNSPKRRLSWEIVRKDRRSLINSLGAIEYKRTLFRNKKTGEYSYLLDKAMGLPKNEHLTEDASARLLEEAVKTSYSKAGEETSFTEVVSRQTVMNQLHSLKFPDEQDIPEEKKKVDYLYIDADEDHVALQYLNARGDLKKGGNGRKNNTALIKLVYVYEGIEPVSPKSKRHRLISPHYFSGVYDKEANEELWEDVVKYLESHYDLEHVKKIYLNADGGSWIQAGKRKIAGIVSVLDEFHFRKQVASMTGHMMDSADDAKSEIYKTIRKGTKEAFGELIERLAYLTETETARERVYHAGQYILSNWTAAKIRLTDSESVVACSAEGHVSHILSDRMSSRPMGWSRCGADKMAHLRAYYQNGGNMLSLVRYQKEELPMAAGAEEEYISSAELVAWEHQHHHKMGKYIDSIQHSTGFNSREKYIFDRLIWTL